MQDENANKNEGELATTEQVSNEETTSPEESVAAEAEVEGANSDEGENSSDQNSNESNPGEENVDSGNADSATEPAQEAESVPEVQNVSDGVEAEESSAPEEPVAPSNSVLVPALKDVQRLAVELESVLSQVGGDVARTHGNSALEQIKAAAENLNNAVNADR